MKFVVHAGLGALVLLAGCAGTMPPAHIYSPSERLLPGPGQQLGATGEAKYCTSGAYASQKASAKQQALANIAKACGGEDKYYVIQEIDAPVRFTAAMGIETACQYGGGRAILFKCTGTPAQPR